MGRAPHAGGKTHAPPVERGRRASGHAARHTRFPARWAGATRHAALAACAGHLPPSGQWAAGCHACTHLAGATTCSSHYTCLLPPLPSPPTILDPLCLGTCGDICPPTQPPTHGPATLPPPTLPLPWLAACRTGPTLLKRHPYAALPHHLPSTWRSARRRAQPRLRLPPPPPLQPVPACGRYMLRRSTAHAADLAHARSFKTSFVVAVPVSVTDSCTFLRTYHCSTRTGSVAPIPPHTRRFTHATYTSANTSRPRAAHTYAACAAAWEGPPARRYRTRRTRTRALLRFSRTYDAGSAVNSWWRYALPPRCAQHSHFSTSLGRTTIRLTGSAARVSGRLTTPFCCVNSCYAFGHLPIACWAAYFAQTNWTYRRRLLLRDYYAACRTYQASALRRTLPPPTDLCY